jgi:antitoxin ParD1/3/4/toxin ParE1/3/4
MKRFVLSQPAKRDLGEIKNYLVEKAGPTTTRRVMKDIRSALVLLGSEPGAGHVREDLTSRPVKFWPIYSYLIVYDPDTKPLQVIRVLHGMRDIKEIL